MTIDEACEILNGHYLYVRYVGTYDHEDYGTWDIKGTVCIDVDWTLCREDVVMSEERLVGVRLYSTFNDADFCQDIPFDGAEHTMRYREDAGGGSRWNIYALEFTIGFVKKEAADKVRVVSAAYAKNKHVRLSAWLIR